MSPTVFKAIVFCFMILILVNLFRGLYFLVTRKEGGRATVRSLAWRIGLSMGLFLLLILLKVTGFVEPHSLSEVQTENAVIQANPKTPEEEGQSLEEIQNQQPSDGRIRLKQD